MSNSTIYNIAAYRFAPLADLKPLRERLLAQCRARGLKGTILLSTEGINLFVAGRRPEIDWLLAELRAIPGLETLQPKVSVSVDQPFSRMLVRIKKEIIAFGVEGIDPARRPAPKISPRELKQWLDEGRPVMLLDTRNDYEVKLGTFHNAVPIGIGHFREFPEAVGRLPDELRHKPVVMFCTGGIRCEKAGPFMQREGFEHVFQLDGGILKYFEDCGGAHYQGECFVFDQRVGIDAELAPTGSNQCFACLTPLSAAEQGDSRYVPGQSCPYCFKTSEDHQALVLGERHEALRRATTPLPGSVPYDNARPILVPAQFEGRTPLDLLLGVFSHLPQTMWQELSERGHLCDSRHEPVPLSHVVRAGERYLRLEPGLREPDVNAEIRLLYEDEAILVFDKPAPLPMHPSGRFNRNTLQYILSRVYAPQCPRPAHRLDANTTGLVVWARTRHFAGLLQPQFARGEVQKVYLARVQGLPPHDSFVSTAAIGHEPGLLGSREVDDEAGLAARTEFRVRQRFDDGTILLEAVPLTGRTNQIRVHLWQLGWPVCGDPTYLPGQRLGETQTNSLAASPLCLHSWRLAFTHPLTKQRQSFETEFPTWAQGSRSGSFNQ